MLTPTMDLSVWRKRARIVAYVDVVLCILALAYTVYMSILQGKTIATVLAHQDQIIGQMKMDNIPSEALGVFIRMTLLTMVVLVATVAFEMWAGILLFKATKGEENEWTLCMGECRIWRFTSIVLVILYILPCVYRANSLLWFFSLTLFRVVLFIVVSNFISALEQAIKTPSNQSPPQPVTVES